MTISIIAAISSNSGLGYQGKLLFNIKKDLQHYKKETLGNNVVFGRKTFEEIIKIHGKGLSGRANIVLTADESYEAKHGEFVFNSIDKIINHHRTNSEGDKKIMICGGSLVYKEFMPYADEVILTHINKHVENVDSFYQCPRIYNLHGHLHGLPTKSKYANQIDIGVDSSLNFNRPFGQPISLNEIITYLDYINPKVEAEFHKERENRK